MTPRRTRQSGQSMTETLLVIGIAALAMAAIPAIADYGLTRMRAVSAARFVAWERNVWMPGTTAIPADEAKGVSGAIAKTDAEVTRDLRRHIFRDRGLPAGTMHDDAYAEFAAGSPPVEPRTTMVAASTTTGDVPSLLDASNLLWDRIRSAQQVLSSRPVTSSLGKFAFVTRGYLRHRVDVVRTDTRFLPMPRVGISEEVTMLTEAWNAGGTIREEKKIQGLVPLKLADSIYYQQLRSGLNQTAYQIGQVVPGFPNANLTFGLQPGDAYERSPLDRFERYPGDGEAAGGSKKDRFRYYRSFPPTPVVNTLP